MQLLGSIDEKKAELKTILFRNSFKYSDTPEFKLAYKEELSKCYIDSKSTTLSPDGMLLVGEVFYHIIANLDSDIDGIGGLTFGSDPISISTAVIANQNGMRLKAFSVRKEQKSHGTQKWIEGTVKPNDRVVIVDDVITTGSSTLKAIKKAREAELEVSKVIVLVDRQDFCDDSNKLTGKERIENEAGVTVIPVFTITDLMELLPSKKSLKDSPSPFTAKAQVVGASL